MPSMPKVRHGNISMILDHDSQSVNHIVEGGEKKHPFKIYDDRERRFVEKYFTPNKIL